VTTTLYLGSSASALHSLYYRCPPYRDTPSVDWCLYVPSFLRAVSAPRKWSVLAYALFILMFNLALPCILYYVLKDNTSLSDHALLGISSATLGISSSFDNPFRMWKLWKHRDLYGPLNDEVRWHMDFSMHLYSFALFPIFAIPLAVASSVNPPLHDFFLMSTPMLVAVPGLFFAYSLFRPRNRMWMSSDAPGTTMKPGAFYLFEDIGAVDFRLGKDFRRTLHERYEASPVYRDLMWYMTLWWACGCAFYFAVTAAITWTVRFGIAFGLVLGLLFAWLAVWAILSVIFAQYFHYKEVRWLEAHNEGHAEAARQMTRDGREPARGWLGEVRRSMSARRDSAMVAGRSSNGGPVQASPGIQPPEMAEKRTTLADGRRSERVASPHHPQPDHMTHSTTSGTSAPAGMQQGTAGNSRLLQPDTSSISSNSARSALSSDAETAVADLVAQFGNKQDGGYPVPMVQVQERPLKPNPRE